MKIKNEEYKSPILQDLLDEVTSCEANKIEKRMLLAINIDEAIKKKGWSKKQFAEKIGQRASVISKWLSGHQNFTMDTLIDIGAILDVEFLNLEKPANREIVYRLAADLKSDGYISQLSARCINSTLQTMSSTKTNVYNVPVSNAKKFSLG